MVQSKMNKMKYGTILVVIACVAPALVSSTEESDWVLKGDKMYKVLSDRVSSHTSATNLCSQISAILPEPRNEVENTNLVYLTSSKFYLGMTDSQTEGTWVWDSDGAIVTWFNWAQWINRGPPVPNGGTGENCAIMLKDNQQSIPKHSPARWVDVPCNWGAITQTDVVCQKDGCVLTQWGCCPDGVTYATGPYYAGCDICPPDWYHVGKHCYRSYPKRVVYADAVVQCKNASVASPMTSEENDELAQFVQTVSRKKTTWLGLKTTFLWTQDERDVPVWTNWDSGYPRDCTVFDPHTLKWRQASCDNSRKSTICTIPVQWFIDNPSKYDDF